MMGEESMFQDFHPEKVGWVTSEVFNMKKDNLGKFDPKSDKGTFLGNSIASKAYKLLSKEHDLDDELKVDEVEISSRNWQMKFYHLEQQIIRNVEDQVKTYSTFKDKVQVAFPFEVKLKKIEETLLDNR
ncbi:hypothetical protein CR513_26776, partial [Mucuna pruriens]